jgi:hypothetical protein
VEPTVYEHPQPNGADQTLVLPDPNSQAIQDLERQIRILGAKVDAFAEARRSLTQTLQTDVDVRSAFFCRYVVHFYFIRNPVRIRISLT